MGHGRGSLGKRPQMLSESRQGNYGISVTNIIPRKVHSSRQQIDYVSLNDGYEDETPEFPKRRHKESYRPRTVPSATRLSAHKGMSSLELIAVEGDASMDAFSAVPSTSGDETLTGVSHAEDVLPDLVVNQPHNNPMIPKPENLQGTVPLATNTLEDLEAASTFLSLGDRS